MRRLLLCCTLLAGCTTLYGRPIAETMAPWVGKPVAELVSTLGAPAASMTLPDSSTVLTWTTPYNHAEQGAPPVMVDCRRSYTISPQGIVTKWAVASCPLRVR